jgi:autotransporter-associated beta strand protein
MLLSTLPAGAQTWNAAPATSNWNTPSNWSTNSAPLTLGSLAAFNNSTATTVSFSAAAYVGGITFNNVVTPNNYTINLNGQTVQVGFFVGAGVTNNSGTLQTFDISSGQLQFRGTSTAGNSNVAYNVSGTGALGFYENSNAGSSVITTTGATAYTVFYDASSGGSARYVSNGGSLFFENSNGVNSLGSIEGSGSITFSQQNGGAAAQTLTVGSLGTDTIWSGTIGEDSGFNASVGSLVKEGNGKLTFTGANAYTGTTTVNAGTLTIDDNGTTTNGRIGSGDVTVNGATTAGGSFGTLVFSGMEATAGVHTYTVNKGAVSLAAGGAIEFKNGATAAGSTFDVNGDPTDTSTAASINFHDTSTAGAATINLNGGIMKFEDSSSAGTANITVNGNSRLHFDLSSTTGTASASGATITVNGGTVVGGPGGEVSFLHHSTGGDSSTVFATMTIHGATVVGAGGGSVDFADSSDASYANITVNGSSLAGGQAGFLNFLDSASAGHATITNNGSSFIGDPLIGTGGGATFFSNDTTASNATLIANDGIGAGGGIFFQQDSLGGTATVKLYGKGFLDISNHTAGSVAIGSLEGSGLVFLGANDLAVGGNNSHTTFSGVIQDGGVSGGTGGTFIKEGTGTLTVTGSNTYTGETQVNGGTLEFGTGGSLDTNGTVAGSITVNDGGKLLLSRSNTFGAQSTSLPVGLTVNAGGTVESNNSFTAFLDPTFNGGTLLSSGGAPVSGVTFGSFGLEGTVTVGGTTATHFSEVISNGLNGILIGALTSDPTTFQVADVTGDSASDLIVSVWLVDYSDVVAGNLTKTGTGTMELNTAANTYTGATNVNAGTLRVNGSLAASSAVTVHNGATLGGSGHISGPVTIMSGGTLAPGNSAGTLTVQSLNLDSGSLLDYELGTPGVVGSGVNDLTVVTSDLTLDGTLNITALSGFGVGVYRIFDYGGILTDNGLALGSVPLGLGFALDLSTPDQVNLVVSLLGNIPLIFNTNGTVTIATPIVGAYSLSKDGPGTLNLTGASAILGDTHVNAGSLLVNGSLATPHLWVHHGGLLGGNGFIYGNVFNSGIVSPGNSPGTLHIVGNYVQTRSGTLLIEINSTHSFDRLVVNGHASLGGTLVLATGKGYKPHRGDSFKILTASEGISGRFDKVINPFPKGPGRLVYLGVDYTNNAVLVEALQNTFKNALSIFQLTPNQTSVAAALDSALFDARQDKVLDYLDALDITTVPHELDKIAPEELTSIFTLGFAQLDSEVLSVQQRLMDIRNSARVTPAGAPSQEVSRAKNPSKEPVSSPVPTEGSYGFFLTASGDFASAGDTHNANGFDVQSAGTALGVDARISDDVILGFTVGYQRSDTDLIDDKTLTADGGKIALYAMYHHGGFFSEGLVGGGYGSYDYSRAGLDGTAHGSTDGAQFDAYYGVGYEKQVGPVVLSPIASVLYSLVGIQGFDETGSLEPLHVESQTGSSLRSRLGLRVEHTDHVGRYTVNSSLSAEWQHEFLDDELAFDSRFANRAGDLFTVHGPKIGRDSALLTAGVNVQWSIYAVYLAYQADLGRKDYESQTVLLGFRVNQ